MVTMVIKKTSMVPHAPQRLGIAEAKANLSEAIRRTATGPVVLHNRGRDVAVLVAADAFDRGRAVMEPTSGGRDLLRRIEALKGRHGGGVDDFQPATLRFVSRVPFRRQPGRAR
jgi:prevent-host-death family protein